jgi:hypothetical protein
MHAGRRPAYHNAAFSRGADWRRWVLGKEANIEGVPRITPFRENPFGCRGATGPLTLTVAQVAKPMSMR